MKRLAVLPAFLLILPALCGFGQTLDLIGHSGGFPNSVTLAFDRLFLSQSLYLKSFDLSNNSLAIKGELEIGDEKEPGGLLVSGTTGYFYSGTTIYTVNLADPDRPVMRGFLDLGGTASINGIAVTGTTLVVSKQADGMKIVDVSNAAAPVLRGTFASDCRDVFADGGRVFMLDGDNQQVSNGSTNLIAVGVTNPAAPTELGRVGVPRAGELVVSGNTAFTAGRGTGRGVRSINVTNPAAMAILDSAELTKPTGSFQTAANGAAVQGNRLYVAVDKDLKVYDIANPANLTEAGTLSFEKGRVTSVDAAGTRGAVISDDRIVLIDLAGGGTPTIRKTLNEPSLIHDIAADGNRQYVVDNKGIYCYDLIDAATAPALRGFFPGTTFDGFGAVAAKGALAVALNFSSDTMVIVDFTNPAAPALRSAIKIGNPTPGGEIGVRGNFAYIAAAGGGGAKIVDISNPAAPVIRATHPMAVATNQAVAIYVPPTGSLIVVQGGVFGSEPKELEIVDVSNPAAPFRRAQIAESQIHGFAVEGNLLVYGFDRDTPRVEMVDITNPSSPVKRNEFVLNTPPVWELEVVDGVIIASIPGGSIHGYLADSSVAPREIFSLETPESSELSVGKLGDSLYVLSVAGGFSDHEAGYSYGSKGKYDVRLNLNDSLQAPLVEYKVMDSADVQLPLGADSLVTMTSVTIGANQTAGWNIRSLTFKTTGTGDEQIHIRQARLYKVQNGRDSLVSVATFDRDNGPISFSISQAIGAGQTETFKLRYVLSNNLCPAKDSLGNELPEPPTFGVELSPEDVLVTLEDSLRAVRNASSRTKSGTVTIGCVENSETGRLFNNISAALADPAFVNGQTISVSRGQYGGPIVLDRPVKLESREGADRTYVNPKRVPGEPLKDNTAFVVGTGGATLERFTIGNESGDPSGTGVKVVPPVNSSDFIKSITINGNNFQGLSTGVDISRALNPVITGNKFRNCVTGARLAETLLGIFKGNIFVRNVNGVKIAGLSTNVAGNRFILNSGFAVDAFLDTVSMEYYDINRNRVAYHDSLGNLIFDNEFLQNGLNNGNRTEKDGSPSIAGADEPNGIILRGIRGSVIGNRFEGDSLDAVFVDNGSDPVFRKNLFLSSHGFGLHNGDPSIIIDARENWWGHPSGPRGAGPGSGDEVSTNVDFDNWLEEEVGLVAETGADTIFVPKGTEESFFIFLQNWKVRDDRIDVSLTDDLGWLKNGGTARNELVDSLGGEMTVDLVVPDVPDGTVNVVRFTATSVANGSEQESDSVVLVSYSSEMFALGIFPGDTILVEQGDSVQFYLLGRDRHGKPVDIGTIQWDADGGTMNGNGLYVAGGTDGLFEVRGRANGFTASGYVRIGDVPTLVGEPAVAGETAGAHLLGASPNPFATTTRVRFALAHSGRIAFTLHDLRGKEVARQTERMYEAGEHEITLNAASLENGVYYFRLRSSEGTSVLKVMVVR